MRVELGDLNILNDDVADTTRETEPFAEDHALVARTDDGLVATDFDRVQSRLIICDLGRRRAALVVRAPSRVGVGKCLKHITQHTS